MKFAILSVPHTGTHFVSDLLGGPDSGLADVMGTRYVTEEHELYVSHVSEGFSIVAPLRHPAQTMESWCNWGHITGQYKEGYTQPSYVPTMFKNLIVMSDIYDITFLPIDSPKREFFLDEFNLKFGLQLETGWRPLNSIGEYKTTTPPELKELTEELLTEHRQFFDKYY